MMIELKEKELYDINGGAVNWSGTFINAITSAGKFIYNLGQALGSSVRRIVGGNYCPL